MFIRRLITSWAALAIAFGITSWLLDGLTVSGGFFAYLWVSLLFGLVNAVIGTILRLITLPLTLITLGLFLLVINAILLEITDVLTRHLTIDSFFWTAIWAALILAVASTIVNVGLSWAIRPARR